MKTTAVTLILVALLASVTTVGLVQLGTGRISIGGVTGGWVTQTVNNDARPDTTYTWRSTGRLDEVVASERKVAEMIAAALGQPSPSPSPTPSPTPSSSLTASPVTIGQGFAVTVTWTGVVNPRTKDWVGLYRVGAADTSFTSWAWATGQATGSVSLPIIAPPGQYEFRYYINDTYVRLLTSNPITVQ